MPNPAGFLATFWGRAGMPEIGGLIQVENAAPDRDCNGLCAIVYRQLRQGLSLLIQLQPDMELAGAVASGKEAVQPFTEQRPDVTLPGT
jgi:hypothetical protein